QAVPEAAVAQALFEDAVAELVAGAHEPAVALERVGRALLAEGSAAQAQRVDREGHGAVLHIAVLAAQPPAADGAHGLVVDPLAGAVGARLQAVEAIDRARAVGGQVAGFAVQAPLAGRAELEAAPRSAVPDRADQETAREVLGVVIVG